MGLKNLRHHDLRHPEELYGALAASAPIQSLRSLVPDGRCLHRVGSVPIGPTLLLSQAGTAAEFVVDHTPNLHLLACFGGRLDLQAAGKPLALLPTGAALLPSGERSSHGSHSLAAFTLEPAAVAAAAAAMAGPRRPRTQALDGFAPLPLAHRESLVLHCLLRTIDAGLALGAQALEALALDDALHRTAAAVLRPDLLEDDPGDLDHWLEPSGRSTFDDLLDFIQAKLDQPLRLSDLEARSHYSRRALQYAFRERLNTTPKQWIREQRLKTALAQFQVDGKRPSVQKVALACGYLNTSHFSRDFKTRFGLCPSEARRS